MKAMQIHTLGKPMRLVEVDKPVPAPGEVQVQVHACGMNFGDTLIVEGNYQEKFEPPFTPGMEICGTVTALGEGVEGLPIGTRIGAYGGSGGLAQYTSIAADRCVEAPDTLSDTEVAAFLVAYGTSHLALERAALKAGETLLVLGASGGVGLTAVELGKLMEAKVIAVARSAEKLAVCKAAGADHLINSETDDIRKVVKSLGGADVVYDPVGGAQFKAALRACNPLARILPLGFASGDIPQIPANILLVKNITVIGYYWGGYTVFAPEKLTNSFKALFDIHATGALKPHISHILPLEQANEALTLLKSRQSTGKVVIAL